jgi:hypothetical protein
VKNINRQLSFLALYLKESKYSIMTNTDHCHLDEETISKLGLTLSDKPVNIQTTASSRVFDYPHLENVFVMESDLYGNAMPKDSCFLAFHGRNGIIGKHLRIETLKRASTEDIRNMVDTNTEG